MLVTVLNVISSGLIMGGVYAIIAMGMSIQYGVARILNVSHGEFIMIGAFLTLVLVRANVNQGAPAAGSAAFRPAMEGQRKNPPLRACGFSRGVLQDP